MQRYAIVEFCIFTRLVTVCADDVALNGVIEFFFEMTLKCIYLYTF